MSRDLTDIILGEGLGLIKFGMTKNQIRMILGEPEEKDVFYLTDEKDVESESWYYDNKGISLSFDSQEDWKLITIEVDSEIFTLKGEPIMGLTKTGLYAVLETLNITDIVEEINDNGDEGSNELLSSEEFEINFWLEENQVSEIQWGPLYNENDEIIWPKNT